MSVMLVFGLKELTKTMKNIKIEWTVNGRVTKTSCLADFYKGRLYDG